MIYIRTDANPNIGMGHIMRCLSIADAFCALGHSPVFILADENTLSLIAERGFEAIVLHSDYKDMEAELRLWDISGIGLADIIIVDSYYVTSEYIREIKAKWVPEGSLVYMDDRMAFPYPVDILVNYNAFANVEIYEYLYRDSMEHIPKLVLGCAFAPLRSMFRNVEKKKQPERVKDILISTGGADRLHLTLALVERLSGNVKDEGVIYHFLLGSMNQDKAKIKLLTRNHDNLILHENVSDMCSLLKKMDLAVSAAGSTLYEICACGVPLITYSTADNQIPGAEAFQFLGLAMNIGDLRESRECESEYDKLAPSSVEKIISALRERGSDYTWRMEVGQRMQKLIDGSGADRMVRKILDL